MDRQGNAGLHRRSVVALCPVFNQRRTLAQTFASISAQDLPMHVVWSDDASTDGSVELLRELIAGYCGPHSMDLRVNPENLGHSLNLFAAMAEYPADYYIEFDDDFSQAQRARSQLALLQANPDLLLIGCNFEYADADGGLLGTFERFPLDPCRALDLAGGRELRVAGHTFAWRGVLAERFPWPTLRVASGDFVVAFRAALLGAFRYFPEVLVAYRTTAQSVSRSPSDHGLCLEDARTYYAHRARVYQGIAAQLKLDLQFAEANGWIDSGLADRLRGVRRDIAYQALSLELSSAAAAGPRWPWVLAALRAMRNPRLRRSAWRHLALAVAPGLFYAVKRMSSGWRS